MNKVNEKFYDILISKESFYMKDYYSNFHKRKVYLAVKDLKDSIYCVLISDAENEAVDYLESTEYIKTLEKSVSFNMIILSDKEYININQPSIAHKLIINRDNYQVIACDKYCMPLKQIFKMLVQENKIKSSHTKESFFKDKIPTLSIILINIIMFIITQVIINKISNVEINNILSIYSTKIEPEKINEMINLAVNNINNSVLTDFGALSKELINQGQVWRLLTCAFLHSGLVHIACNMYSLYIIGPQIQQIYGVKKYFSIYISSCITSSLLSYFMSPYGISVGASGGIFGLMGALLAFAIIERRTIQKKYMSSLIQIIVINLFIGLSIKNIDNFAHIGGLAGGLLVGYIFYRRLNEKYRKSK